MERSSAKIDIPARRPEPVPEDVDEHLIDFCNRYWEPLEATTRKRMREVGVPEEKIGMPDANHDFRLAAFHPDSLFGGEIHYAPGRINVDAGLFKPGLLDEAMPPDVSWLHDASPASVKLDAIIAHEYEEGIHGNHLAALEHAPDTSLAIKEKSRGLLRAEREGRI